MTIIESQDLWGVDIVTVIDEENNTAESMTKSEYQRRQALKVEHLTEIPTPDEA